MLSYCVALGDGTISWAAGRNLRCTPFHSRLACAARPSSRLAWISATTRPRPSHRPDISGSTHLHHHAFLARKFNRARAVAFPTRAQWH
eukprot:363690-Chlamydomonas_euryale.AAC.4